MPDPRTRSPAQIAAARRNGARSRGPVTAKGKARASRKALKHGLTAMHHLALEDETPSELEELTARLMVEVAPMSWIAAGLARRLAIAFWKGERAGRIEVVLFDATPRTRPKGNGFTAEPADPLATFDLKRFNAVRGHQAQQGREISRCLKELRALRRDALADGTDEPESPPPPANDDDAVPVAAWESAPRNEPDDLFAALPEPVAAELNRLLAADDWVGLARLAATGALAPSGMTPADLASPKVPGRFLFPPQPKAQAPAPAAA